MYFREKGREIMNGGGGHEGRGEEVGMKEGEGVGMKEGEGGDGHEGEEWARRKGRRWTWNIKGERWA